MITFFLLTIFITLFGGIISGLFGGGSGIIFVPGFFSILSYYYPHSDHLMQVGISTGFASSVFIGIFASRKQINYGYVPLEPLKSNFLYIMGGAIIGTILMTYIPSSELKIFFVIVLFLVAIWMTKRLFIPAKKKIRIGKLKRNIIGFSSGLCTVMSGVSAFFVPFFIYCGLEIKSAIGASTIVTFSLTLMMSTLTILLGLNASNLPPYCLGYLNIAIVSTAIIPSIIGAVIGSKLTHVLPMKPLQYIYIAMIIVVGITIML